MAPSLLVPLLLLPSVAAAASGSRNVTIVLGSNNVASLGRKGNPPDPQAVLLLGVVSSMAACEELCFKKTKPLCQSFTWHHTDFTKANYRGHCYAHTDSEWAPITQSKIDSGCRNDLPAGPACSHHPAPLPPPPPPPAPFKCSSDFDCSGHNGVCASGSCKCNPGWSGTMCSTMVFVPKTGRVAYTDPLWSWGGSPIMEAPSSSGNSAGQAVYHLFSSRMSNNCGILHVRRVALSAPLPAVSVRLTAVRLLTAASSPAPFARWVPALAVLHELGSDTSHLAQRERTVHVRRYGARPAPGQLGQRCRARHICAPAAQQNVRTLLHGSGATGPEGTSQVSTPILRPHAVSKCPPVVIVGIDVVSDHSFALGTHAWQLHTWLR